MTKADEYRDGITVVTTCHTDVELEDAKSSRTEGKARGGIHYHALAFLSSRGMTHQFDPPACQPGSSTMKPLCARARVCTHVCTALTESELLQRLKV